MKKKIIYRNAVLSDIPQLVVLEQKVWGEDMGAGSDIWKKRINVFSDGIFIAEQNNVIMGVVVIHRIKWNYPVGYYPIWLEVSGNGQLDNYDPRGDTFYGDDMTVLPGMPGIASELIKMSISLKYEKKLSRGFLGCRILSLRTYVKKNNIKPEEVNEKLVMERAKKDLEVRFFKQNGFKIVAVRRNYFPPDEESLGWGAIVESP